MLFKDIREAWWLGQSYDKREITLYRKSEIIRCHIIPFFDDMQVEDITDVDINLYIQHEQQHGNRLTNGPLCQNSIKKALEIINNVLEYAVAKDYISKNPMALIPCLKRVAAKEFSIFHSDEIPLLIVAARPKWLGDMILLAYNTGMRKEEIFGLQWCDVDFEHKVLHVNHTIVAVSPQRYYIDCPKNRTSSRDIMLDNSSIQMLMQRKRCQKITSEWVFANQYGQAPNPWYNVKYFRNACIRAGIPPRRFHDLRHTHITELMAAGQPPAVVQVRAGHSNIKTTMRYTHISPMMQEGIVDFLNNRDLS